MREAALAPVDPPPRTGPGTVLRPRVPGRRARRALGAFAGVYLAGSFAGALLALVCPIELRAPEVRPVLGAARTMPRPPDVATFGSSRLHCAVDTRRITARLGEAGVPGTLVLDAWVAAGDPLAFDALLAALAAEGRAPRLAVVEMSPESVARSSRFLKPQLLRFATLRQLARLDPGDGVAASVQGALATILFAPFDRYRGPLLNWLLTAAGLPRQPETWEPRTWPPGGEGRPAAVSARPGGAVSPLEVSRRERPRFDRWLRNYRPGGLPGDGLRSFLARARRLGTRVALVGVPVSSPLRAARTPEVLAAYRAWVDGVARGSGATYHELGDLLADGDFLDEHHASGSGAARFSDELARRVVAPLLREGR